MVFVCIKFEAVKIGKKIRMDIKENCTFAAWKAFDLETTAP
jgi:hypothetical protein